MSDKYPVWEKLNKAERHGSFIEVAMNGEKASVYKTDDVDSSIDLICEGLENIEDGYTISDKFRKVVYRRIEVQNNKQKVIVWDEQGNAVISKFAFDEVYYLPFHNCFFGSYEKMLFLFDADISKDDGWYLYSEIYQKYFIFGKFIMYSVDGKRWGLVDGEDHKKVVPPFFEIVYGQEEWKLRCAWVDEFVPVVIDKRFFLMDCHGNCFAKMRPYAEVVICNNVILDIQNNVMYGLNPDTRVPIELRSLEQRYRKEYLLNDNFVERSREGKFYVPDAYDNLTDVGEYVYWSPSNRLMHRNNFNDKMFSYYGEIMDKTPVNSYSKTPLKIRHY